jgi:hypothetical protein
MNSVDQYSGRFSFFTFRGITPLALVGGWDEDLKSR